jgi:uncharacterized protein (DUF1810 family)
MEPATNDPHNLKRFVDAQAGSHEIALAELRAGQKASHWMWFIFPQVAGLGTSSMAVRYAIKSRAEAKAFLEHPLLGSRLLDCARALLGVSGRSASEIMGSPDDLKLKSSMTLFSEVSENNPEFEQVLDRYFQSEQDDRTIAFLSREPTP